MVKVNMLKETDLLSIYPVKICNNGDLSVDNKIIKLEHLPYVLFNNVIFDDCVTVDSLLNVLQKYPLLENFVTDIPIDEWFIQYDKIHENKNNLYYSLYGMKFNLMSSSPYTREKGTLDSEDIEKRLAYLNEEPRYIEKQNNESYKMTEWSFYNTELNENMTEDQIFTRFGCCSVFKTKNDIDGNLKSTQKQIKFTLGKEVNVLKVYKKTNEGKPVLDYHQIVISTEDVSINLIDCIRSIFNTICYPYHK